FSDAELTKLDAAVRSNPLLRIAAGPPWNAARQNLYQYFLSLGDVEAEQVFLARHPLNVAPVVDDQPFYFRFSYWSHLFPRDPQLWALVPSMEYSVILLLLAIGVTAIVCVWLPLRRAESAKPIVSRFAIYFAALGLGYMAVEMALLQQFGLFLGHPSYALSVVLAGLLFATGLGALSAERIVARLGGVRFVAYLFACVVFVELFVLFPRLPSLMASSFGARCIITLALIAPVGVCLGVFLPSGLERLKESSPHLVPWAWGVNGIFSVLGPVFAIAFSITFGMSALLVIAVPIYLVAGWLFPRRYTSTNAAA
ncbi:MAG: hypothetical protein KF819_39275, partial [Labilithrix sp.]|nr:hypothetical protein [Labilithrix sp.]